MQPGIYSPGVGSKGPNLVGFPRHKINKINNVNAEFGMIKLYGLVEL